MLLYCVHGCIFGFIIHLSIYLSKKKILTGEFTKEIIIQCKFNLRLMKIEKMNEYIYYYIDAEYM